MATTPSARVLVSREGAARSDGPNTAVGPRKPNEPEKSFQAKALARGRAIRTGSVRPS